MIEVNGLSINFTATIIATIMAFLLGFIWYMYFFKKSWSKEMGYDMEMSPTLKSKLKGMTLLLMGSFLFSWVLSFYFAGWDHLPGSAEEFGKSAYAFNSALSVLMGFFIPIGIYRVVWENHSWKLFGINFGFHTFMVMIVSFVIVYY